MKLFLLLLASIATTSFGQVPTATPAPSKMQGSALDKATTTDGPEIPREEAAKMKSMDLWEINEQGPVINGQVIKMRFNYRSRLTKQRPDGGLTGDVYLWRSPGGNAVGKYRYGSIHVSIPPEAVAWFTKIPSAEESRTSIVVIARIKNNGRHAEFLGREIKTDLKGTRAVW